MDQIEILFLSFMLKTYSHKEALFYDEEHDYKLKGLLKTEKLSLGLDFMILFAK